MSKAYEDKEYSVFQIAFNMAMACIISGSIIGITYFFTAPIAKSEAEKLKQQAMQNLVTDASEFRPIADKHEWFEAKKGTETIAYIVEGTGKGFGGEIEMLVAISLDGKVIDYTVLKHNETPGLGDKGDSSPFKDHIKGKGIEGLEVVKGPSEDKVQALTGATITSRAIVNGLNDVVEEVMAYKEGK